MKHIIIALSFWFFFFLLELLVVLFVSRRVWFQVHGFQPFEGLAETDRAIPVPAALRDNRPLLFESYYEAAFAVRPGELEWNFERR